MEYESRTEPNNNNDYPSLYRDNDKENEAPGSPFLMISIVLGLIIFIIIIIIIVVNKKGDKGDGESHLGRIEFD